MKPYYETELGKLYHGDCLEIMPELEPVDLVVTSPPYDDLRDYGGYTFDYKRVAENLYLNVAPGGVIVWVVGDATVNGSETGTSFKQALYFKDVGFNLHDTMIWMKSKMPQNHNRYEQGFEYMFILSKGKPKSFNGIKDKKNIEAGTTAHASYRDRDGVVKKTKSFNQSKIAHLGLRYNIWDIVPCLSKVNRNGHPAPFPEQLVHDHIISWSNEGDMVSDIMSGSGTTLKMAEKLNRRWIGIEIEEKYCEIAAKRIEKENQQLKLW